jgi:hypothetical protein
MIVRILKSSYKNAWYAKHIGEQFEVEKRTNKHGAVDYVLIPFDLYKSQEERIRLLEEQVEIQQKLIKLYQEQLDRNGIKF